MEEMIPFRTSRIFIFAPSILILLILGLAAYLRLYNISGYMTFLGDEGRDVLVVKHMIVDHKFTLLGPTASVGGFFLGPIYYYFMLPFLWLWHMDPSGPAVMVALFGIATVYFLYRLGKELFNESVGLVAACLYALSPVVIAYSRSSWNPNVVPFFSVLLIHLLWWSVRKKKIFGPLWIGIVLGIGLQLHYLFLFLFPVVAIWFYLNRRSLGLLKVFLYLGIGFIVGYAPFLAFEIRHGFPNTLSIIRFIFTGKDTGFVLMTFLSNLNDVSYRMFGRLVFRLPQPESWSQIPLWQQISWLVGVRFFLYTSIVLLVSGILPSYKKISGKLRTVLDRAKNIFEDDKERQAVVLLSTWFFPVLLLFGLYRRAIYDYYFGIVFVLPFLLVSVILVKAMKLPLGRILSVIVIVFLVYLNWQGRPFRYAPNNQLEQTKKIARTALDKTGGKPFNFALMANYNSDHAYRYFFEIWGNTPVTLENITNDPERKSVTNQLIVICELSECHPLGNSLWEIAGFGRAEITGEWDVPFVKIFRLIHYNGS